MEEKNINIYILCLQFLSICLLSVLLSSSSYPVNILHGVTAPDFSLNTIDGKSLSLSDFKDKLIILIYWRPDQDRSLLAIKEGQDIFTRYRDKQVQVLGLIADDVNIDAVHKILNDNKIEYPVFIDSGRQVYGTYGIRVYPMTIIIGKTGKLVYDLPGHSLNYKNALEGHVRHILGEIDDKELQAMVSPHNIHIDQSLLKAHRKYNLALKFVELRFFDQAIGIVEESLEAEKDYAPSHVLLGYLYLHENDSEKAFDEFNIAIKLDSGLHDAKTGLGATLVLQGKPDLAIQLLNKAVAGNPNPEITYYELGKANELKGDMNRALEMYKRSVDKLMENKILPSSVSECK
jgi:tetratricopeptide (TPR) repeat protein